VLNSMRYSTIAEVFLNNFEALGDWGACLSVPHRMPAALL
jgi:hypothetical protein